MNDTPAAAPPSATGPGLRNKWRQKCSVCGEVVPAGRGYVAPGATGRAPWLAFCERDAPGPVLAVAAGAEAGPA